MRYEKRRAGAETCDQAAFYAEREQTLPDLGALRTLSSHSWPAHKPGLATSLADLLAVASSPTEAWVRENNVGSFAAAHQQKVRVCLPALFGAIAACSGESAQPAASLIGGAGDSSIESLAGSAETPSVSSSNGSASGASSTGGGPSSGGAGAPSVACASVAPPARGLRVRLLASQGLDTAADRPIGLWRNVVEGGPDAEQAEPERQPILIHDGINGRPVVRLDGNDDYLAFNFPVSGKTELTLATVSRTWEYQRASPNSDCGDRIGRELNCSGTDQSVLCWTEEGNAFTEQGIFYGLGQREATFRFGTGDSYPHYKTPFVLERPNEERFVFGMALLDGQLRKMLINGAVPRGRPNYESNELIELSTNAEGGAVRAEPIAWIGKGRFTPASSFWAGELAELLVYEVALDLAEQSELEAYVRCSYFPNGYGG